MRSLFRSLFGVPKNQVRQYLEDFLKADTWVEFVHLAETYELYTQSDDLRAAIHKSIWKSPEQTSKVLDALSRWKDSPTFYGKGGVRNDHQLLGFFATGRMRTLTFEPATNIELYKMFNSMLNRFDTHADTLLKVFPDVINTANIHFSDVPDFLKKVDPTRADYPKALLLSYYATCGCYPSQGFAAIDALRPHLLKLISHGFIEAVLALEEDPLIAISKLCAHTRLPELNAANTLPSDFM